MGSSQKNNQTAKTTTDNTTNMEVTGIAPYQEQFASGYADLASMFKNRVGAPLNLTPSFTGFSSTLDPIIQNQVAQGVQSLNSANTTANQELANRLNVSGTGSNSALLAALQRQSQMSTAGNRNALVPGALSAQRDFDVQRANLINQQNAQTLAGRAQSVNELAPGFNLLQAINQMAQTSAGKRVTEKGTTEQTGNTYTRKSYF